MDRSSVNPAPGLGVSHRDRAVAAIVRHWRHLTSPRRADGRLGSGSRTMVACSGGADSCALVLALAAATDELVVGHVVHDLRSRAESLAGRDAARNLAERLGLEFVESEISVHAPQGVDPVGSCRNIEQRARAARYAALADMARDRRIAHLAIAHHADDQLETVLMSLVRGVGAGGIRGMPERRRLPGLPAVSIVRPMLCPDVEINRATCRRLCTLAGVEWSEDVSNADTSRLRAAVRHRIAPVLKELRPAIGRRAISAARQAAGVQELVTSAARRACDRGERVLMQGMPTIQWSRAQLRDELPVVIAETLRRGRRELVGRAGADRVSKSGLDRIAAAILDSGTDPRTFDLGGIAARVTARTVSLCAEH